MRLAVVSPFLDRRHGTERALVELLERLARDYPCEVHLFARSVADLPVTRWTSRSPAQAGVIFWHPVPSLRVPLLVDFILWFFLNRFLRWRYTRSTRNKFDLVLSPGINCSDADVIIVHAIFASLRQLALRRSDSAAAAASPRLHRRVHRRFYYALLTFLERRIYTDPRVALAAVSSRTAEQLATLFARNDARVIPNGVDTAYFSPVARAARREAARRARNLKSGDLLLLLIGNDWEVKGLATVLRAMASLPNLPLHLLVVGSDAPESFQHLSRTLCVFDRCIWEKPAADVRDFYAAADIYLSPSREDSFGLPVAEAMASGLPAITSAAAGVSRLVQDGIDAFVLNDPQDAPTLAKLLQLLHDNPDLRNRIAAAAAHSAEAWTWDRNAAAMWELLQSVASR